MLIVVLTLAACDPGSGEDLFDSPADDTSSPNPIVTAPANITVAATNASGTAAGNATITAFLNGASANDAVDGPIATINNDAPAVFPLGATIVTFSAIDSDGNTGSAQATVTVSDQDLPVIALLGLASITLNVGDPFTDPGATATDNVDGNLTPAIVAGGSVNTAVVGIYTLTYDVSDSAANAAVQVTRSVSVQDAGAPVVTPPAPITVAAVDASGTAATDAAIVAFLLGASALDAVDGAITPTNDAPVQFPLGVTTVTFSATDSSANTGQAQATVTVTDQTLPIVTAPADITVAATGPGGIAASDPAIVAFLAGASATDNVDGAIATISNNAPGTLPVGDTTVTFSATDAAGNTGTAQAIITVDPPPTITSFELIDPTPGAGDHFGEKVVVLGNGNIVVTDPLDSSVVGGVGAVHLFDPLTQTVISSIYGDVANDNLGSGDIVELANNNYVIVSPLDDEGGVVDAGSVRLMHGATGAQIGTTLSGDLASDQMGEGGVTALGSGNYVVASAFDNEGLVSLAGTVRLMNGTTGAQIGTAISGDLAGDSIGAGGVTELANGNYVIASPFDTEGFAFFAGSVRLVNGATGAPIGAAIVGDSISDAIGLGGIVPLANSNFAILSPGDDIGLVTDAGSVMLVNGSTGAQIGSTIAGDVASDQLGLGISVALSNNNFAFGSLLDDEAGIVDAGSVRLIDGTSGAQIGATYAGSTTSEQVGLVTAIGNGNYVIASPFADIGPVANAGRVQLMDGSSAASIGTAIEGDIANDQLGFGTVVGLANDNYVISSVNDDAGVVDAGTMILADGTSGAQIGSTVAGDVAGDQLGLGTLILLQNNKFVLGSSLDNENGVADAGTARLFDGDTGALIGPALAGDIASDQLGNFNILPLANGNYVVISSLDDEGAVVDAGSARLVSGTTGLQIGSTIAGNAAADMDMATVGAASNGDFFVLGLSRADNNSSVDSGFVFLNAD